MPRTELTAESVVDGLVPRAPAVSPDGAWVAYGVAPVGQVGAWFDKWLRGGTMIT